MDESSFVFDPMDAESVAGKAKLVCACLDAIRADGEGWCSVLDHCWCSGARAC